VDRLTELQNQILRRYTHLWEAIVVASESATSVERQQEEKRKAHRFDADQRRTDDLIHKTLGVAMARSINEWRVRDGDKIGFGSGRGVFFTVEAAMLSPTELRVEGLDLISLTGAVHAREHANLDCGRMDADLHAAMFAARCVQNAVTLHLVSYPATSPDARENTCLGRTQWANCHPTHALAGIGVLAEGHRFFDEFSGEADPDPILDNVRDPLSELVDLCSNIASQRGIYPVADLGNCLFLVDHSDIVEAERKRLDELIRSVNERLLNVTGDQLRDIQALLIVAGGKRKADALRYILDSQRAFKTRIICIDQTLAEELLRR
jgi:DNA-binding transcriptional regulator LsrR (DeoR family)